MAYDNGSSFISFSNSSGNVSSSLPKDLDTVSLAIGDKEVFTVMCVLQMITGSALNGFVILLMCLNLHLLEIPSNLILFNLAVSDFLVCVAAVPLHLDVVLTDSRSHQEVISLYGMVLFSTNVSMFGVVIMTVDRYVAVTHPLRYNTLITSSTTRRVLAIDWFVSCIHSIGFILSYIYNYVVPYRYTIVISNSLCIVAILWLTLAIFRCSRQQIRKIAAQERNKRQSRILTCKKTLKSARTSAIVVFTFLCSYLPLLVFFVVDQAKKKSGMANPSIFWAMTGGFWNSCANPVLYCIFSEKLRATTRATYRRLIS